MLRLLQKKKTVIFVLALLMLSTSLVIPPVRGQDIDTIQAQMNQINGQISSLQTDLTNNQNQVSSLLSQKSSLQANLGTIQNLLNQATQKENQINSLIASLQQLKDAVQNTLQQKIALKDNRFVSLYEASQENPMMEFLSTQDAKTFLYKFALNESAIESQKLDIINLNKQITDLQASLDQEAKEKTIQDAQVKTLSSQKSQLQSELWSVQNSYNHATSQINSDQGQINYLQQQYGQLSAQENAILAAKYSSGGTYQYLSSVPTNCQSSATPTGNLGGGATNTFSIAVNGHVIQSGISGPVKIVPNDVNTDATITGASKTGCFTGDLEFRADTNVNFINQNSLENYVQGIGEMPIDWDLKAHEVQAVAARTYALYCKDHLTGSNSTCAANNENSNHYDLDNTTNYQSYVGVQGGVKIQAELNTLANVIFYGGTGSQNVIDAFYSANNGGYERSNAEVWGSSPYAYLPSQSDSFGSVQYDNFSDPDGMCAAYQRGVSAGEFYRTANPSTWGSSGRYGTDGVLSITGGAGSFAEVAGIAKELNSGVQVGSINLNNPSQYESEFTNAVGTYNYASFSFGISGNSSARSADSTMSASSVYNTVISSSGNMDFLNTITIHGSSGTLSLSQSSLYLAFNLASPGDDYLTSPLWYFVNSGGSVVFYAFGFGHSIGMSQCGAEGRAAAGQDYVTILKFYYTNNVQVTTDGQIVSTDPQLCAHVDSSYPNNDACIRVGIDGYSANDNIVTEHGAYNIYIGNNSFVYSGGANDTIEIVQH